MLTATSARLHTAEQFHVFIGHPTHSVGGPCLRQRSFPVVASVLWNSQLLVDIQSSSSLPRGLRNSFAISATLKIAFHIDIDINISDF